LTVDTDDTWKQQPVIAEPKKCGACGWVVLSDMVAENNSNDVLNSTDSPQQMVGGIEKSLHTNLDQQQMLTVDTDDTWKQ